MKSILLSGTAALLLVAASGAYAQPDQHDHPGASDNHAGGDQHTGADQHNNTTAGNHGAMTGDHGAMSGPGAANKATTTHTTTHRTRSRRHTTTHTTSTTTNGNDHNNSNNNDHNNDNDHNNNNNNDHNNNDHANNSHPHGQLDVHLRVSVNAAHHFRGPTWHAPAGYTYRRYNVGQRLEPAFYARDYWLTDYAAYDLIAPPDGYTWVRFGPDAILIDEDTGDVVRVVYGVFI
jgi:Ni/Co efflux regulator RcnB